MFLPNAVVYIQFHPVAYMVKLNIEMSMASLVVKLAQGKPENDMYPDAHHHSSSGPAISSDPRSQHRSTHLDKNFQSFQLSSVTRGHKKEPSSDSEGIGGITRRMDFNVVVESSGKEAHVAGSERVNSKDNSLAETLGDAYSDETPLHNLGKGGMRVTAKDVV